MSPPQEPVDRLRSSPPPIAPERVRPFGALRLTSLGSWAVTMATVLTGLGLVRGDVWMYLLALLALAALVVSVIVVPRLPQMTVMLVVPEMETAGRPTRAQLVIRSGTHRVPRHHLTAYSSGDRLTSPGAARLLGTYVVVEAMSPGQTQTLDVELQPQIRGLHERLATHHQTVAPFALVRRASVQAHVTRRTVAAGIDTSSVQAAALLGEGDEGPVTITRSGPDVHSLRAWAPGDGTAVHWRTTARRGEPVVVDRESRVRTSLVVVVGPATSIEGEDSVVARAAGAAQSAARSGAEVHLVSDRGVESLAAHEVDDLLRWTAATGPASQDQELVEQALLAAGTVGRLLVVHGAGTQVPAWHVAAEQHDVDVVDLVVDARPVFAPPEPPGGDLTRPLRIAVLASLAGGVLSLVVTGVLTGAAALGWSVVLAVLGVAGAVRPQVFADRTLRSVASTAAVGITAVMAFRLISADELAAGVAALLCGISAAQMVGAGSRRDGLVALSLGPVMVVASAGFGPGPELVVPTVVVASAVLAGLAVVASSALADGATTGDRPAPRSAVPAGAGLSIAAAVVLGLVAFLVLPLGSAPTMGASLLGDRQRQLSPNEEAAQRTPSYFGDSMDLSARGRLPDTTTFTVERGAPTLWRAQTHDLVLDGVWSSEPQRTAITSDTGRVAVPADPTEAGDPRGEPREFTVRPTTVSMLVAPGPPLSVTGQVVLGQQQTNGFIIDSGVAPYVVTAIPRERSDELQRQAPGPDLTDPVFVALDATTTARTRELATAITAGRTDRVEQVQAVEQWLGANVRYQLDAPLPPDGQDAVDFLLFDSRAGFCEHFAAAEAILLRSLAIPARIATGYSVSDAVVDADGWSVVRDSDAHAWVEVWIPGHGWVASDPTAGSTLADADASDNPLQRLRNAWNRLWSNDAGRRLLAVALVGIAMLGALVVIVRRHRRRSARVPAATGARAATLEPLAAFGRLRSALIADGHDFAPGDGISEMRLAVPGDAELQAALDVVERTLYDRAVPASQQRLATAAVLDSRTSALVARRGMRVDV